MVHLPNGDEPRDAKKLESAKSFIPGFCDFTCAAPKWRSIRIVVLMASSRRGGWNRNNGFNTGNVVKDEELVVADVVVEPVSVPRG